MGYYKDPWKTKEAFDAGWFSTGDMARRDRDGYYTLVDKKSNMIITGGENVYPSEVENVLETYEAVKEVAVIGIPDEKWGESIRACVVLNEGWKPGKTLVQDLIEFTRNKITVYKRPKSIDFIKDEEMPRTATEKILHWVLRSKYGRSTLT